MNMMERSTALKSSWKAETVGGVESRTNKKGVKATEESTACIQFGTAAVSAINNCEKAMIDVSFLVRRFSIALIALKSAGDKTNVAIGEIGDNGLRRPLVNTNV